MTWPAVGESSVYCKQLVYIVRRVTVKIRNSQIEEIEPSSYGANIIWMYYKWLREDLLFRP
jgi:hypothetical protein